MSKAYTNIVTERQPPEKNMLHAGPWDDEPDYHEWDVDGIKCILMRGPVWSWCGYIGIPVSNVLFHADEEELDEHGLRLHGGITYGPGRTVVGRPGITPYWWVGFDTAHASDYAPGLYLATACLDFFEQLRKETGKMGKELRNLVYEKMRQGEIARPRRYAFDGHDVYRDLEYCKHLMQESAEAMAKGNMK